jgi:TRAP-type transport system small permease protein
MFERVFVGLNRWLLILLLAAMVVIVFANVLMRYVFGTSVIWSEEVARHLMIWMTFVGSGLALRTGAQLGIDSLQNALPPRGAFCWPGTASTTRCARASRSARRSAYR